MRDDITLHIGGQLYYGWKELSVNRSIEAAADDFSFTITDKWAESMKRRPIRLGSPAEVFLGKEKIVTGYIDRVRPRTRPDSRTVQIAGRSKIADLVDCSDYPRNRRYVNQTLASLAREVAKPYGITVIEEAETQRISAVVAEKEETGFEFLEKQARAQAVRLVGNADGNLVITRASNQRIETALVMGENIEEAEAEHSHRNRFSHYYFPGQRPGSDETMGADAAHILGRAEDTVIRYRPTTIVMEGSTDPAGAKRRAEWQRNVNYGRSRSAAYTVTGWRHKDDIWRPNRLVYVNDPWSGFDGEWLMIASVEFVRGKSGRRTKLGVMGPEAFDLIPLPAEDDEGGWG
ncbi:phage baseplate assembly protein [Thiohalomonas denitrificans]|uniref:phage baseplate assembly protein n=1 Tax=Thiohalomonas denitrificans TaxID=415747 RepID=UPI0026F1EEFF|nr:hypothetical protein [Thiohalomonas denitrificans]